MPRALTWSNTQANEQMIPRSGRALFHSSALTLLNLASAVAAFGIYHFLRPADQIAIQAPLAAIFSIAGFLVWSFAVSKPLAGSLSLRHPAEFLSTYLFALLWSPVIFIPLHYVSRGYLTSFGNIFAIWMFQLPTNLLAILVVKKVVRSV